MSESVTSVVRRLATPVRSEDVARTLFDAIDPDISLVLVGEATHGSHEFYRIRADLTRLLVERRGFSIVAVEADWPDAYRANRWVRLVADDDTAEAALADFTRFPRWMWRNREVVRFLRWLRAHNAALPAGGRAGFYGLDLYSLHRSMASVVRYLEQVDPNAARDARQRYGCFDIFGDEPQAYGYAASVRLTKSCEDAVVRQLLELRERARDYVLRDGLVAAEAYFAAEQNARVVADAEAYYRAMFRGGAESWNLRDRHMMATLQALLEFAPRAGQQPRAVVWAHNSHLGDARVTAMARMGELNLGQLVRERHQGVCCLVGMTTHHGSVTAAQAWDEPAELREVRPALPDSYERLFHDTALPAFLLDFANNLELAAALSPPRLERAIGVIYQPDTERQSHYFQATLPRQFDLVVHVDRTRALEPLDKWARHEVDLPETYPTGV